MTTEKYNNSLVTIENKCTTVFDDFKYEELSNDWKIRRQFSDHWKKNSLERTKNTTAV